MNKIIETCCGSYEDALAAYRGGAKRIELNSALHLGGLTPSLGSLHLVKKNTDLKVIAMGADRVLTSGLKAKAMDGIELIEELQKRYGDRIEILAGSGINASNAMEIMKKTGIHQVHSSCKGWVTDSTTTGKDVSYSYAEGMHRDDYDVVDEELVRGLMESIKKQ